jgi:RNA polymerase sigma-70 factor (ECF subfamily)
MSEKEKNLDLFVRLLSRHQGQIYAYILSVIGNYNDSDDILQETSGKLWEIFDRYEPGTDFLKWSLSVAYYRILEYRKKAKRSKTMIYTDEFFKQLSDSAPNHLSRTREHLEKLKHCIEKLQPREASLIALRYNKSISVREIAARINRPIRSVYFSLTRVQHLLLKCIGE